MCFVNLFLVATGTPIPENYTATESNSAPHPYSAPYDPMTHNSSENFGFEHLFDLDSASVRIDELVNISSINDYVSDRVREEEQEEEEEAEYDLSQLRYPEF